MTACNCPDLAAAIRNLQNAVEGLRDELRAFRQALPSADTEALVALHERPRVPEAQGSTS